MQFKYPRSYSSALKPLKTTAPTLCENWVCTTRSSLYAMRQRLVLSTSIFGKSEQPTDTQKIFTPIRRHHERLPYAGGGAEKRTMVRAKPSIPSPNRKYDGRWRPQQNLKYMSNGFLWILRAGARGKTCHHGTLLSDLPSLAPKAGSVTRVGYHPSALFLIYISWGKLPSGSFSQTN